MNRVKRWGMRIGIILLFIIIILVGVGGWFIRRPWPQVQGNLTVPGLQEPVEIIRDGRGVPHIYAKNDHDLFFAQGYVHAQDQLWQMEVNRRLSNGTLSEILGESAVDTDRFLRTIGLRRIAEQSWPELDEDSRTILEAYTAGVNTYIDTHLNQLPLEYTILGVSPEHWSPLDSLAWGNMLAIYGGHNFKFELLRAEIMAKVGEEAAQQFLPLSPIDTPVVIPEGVNNYANWFQNNGGTAGTDLKKLPGTQSWGWASNTWVVSGGNTETGMPLLANDPHASFLIRFYENGLHDGRFESVGFTFPGVPLVIVGHNQHIAWGVSILNADVEDAYIEKVDNTQHPEQYEFLGKWNDIEVIKDTIKVKGSEPVEMEIRLTRHGPIINDVLVGWWPGLETLPEKTPITFRWAVQEGNAVLRSIKLLNLATNWDEFRAALHYWETSCQNFVYADVEGNIGYQAAGKIPIRTSGHQGTVPVPGWTGEYEWEGFIPFDELPSVLNPDVGFVVAANNQVTSDDYPYPAVNYLVDPGYRAKRITDILSTNNHFTLTDMQQIQLDTYSIPVGILRPYLSVVEPEGELQAEAMAQVNAWDLYFDADSVGASIYATWYHFFLQDVVIDEYGERTVNSIDYTFSIRQLLMLITLIDDADNDWFDDKSTSVVETRDDIIRRSFDEAIAWLREKYGDDISKWQWGKMHTVTFTHFPLGISGIAPLEYFFNSKRLPLSGDEFSVNAYGYTMTRPYEVIYGPGQRLIFDMSDWDNTLVINATGQSGHLFHTHHWDQLDKWQKGEYSVEPFTREAVEESATEILTLIPQ